MNPEDFWTWNKESLVLALFAGILFAVGDAIVKGIVGVYKKRRAASASASDR